MPTRPRTHRPPGALAAQAARARRADQERQEDQPHRRLYNLQHYRRFRIYLLSARPVCQRCGCRAATEVHHVRGLATHPEDLVDEDRCEALCKGCHDALGGKATC